MSAREAQDRAARLGLSAWITEAIAVDPRAREAMSERHCVGFASADLVIGEGETWNSAFEQAERIVFGA